MSRFDITPTVSAMMPAYNEEAVIGDAIQSIVDQSFEDWELIVLDDGSTDKTPDVVLQFDDPRIRYVRQENQGRGAARNAALAATCGRYIAITDADDISLPTRFEKEVAFLESHSDVAVVSAQMKYFTDTLSPTFLFAYPETSEAINERFARGAMAVAHAACLIRRELYEWTGPYENVNREFATEDLDLFLRATGRFTFAALPEVLVHYRWDPRTIHFREWIKTCQFIDYSNYRHRCWKRDEQPKSFAKRTRRWDRWAKLLTWDAARFLRFRLLCHRSLTKQTGSFDLR